MKSTRANVAVANEDTNTANMRTRTDDIESLRRRLILSESRVAKEKDNVTRGLEEISRKNAQLSKLRMEYITHVEWSFEKLVELRTSYVAQLDRAVEIFDELMDRTGALEKLRAEKEAEIQELKVQKEAELQKVKVHKKAEVQKVINENIRLLRIVDKKEAQIQALSEHCKLLALKHHN
ncbi:unnamed protein product [Urochloa humidicola]